MCPRRGPPRRPVRPGRPRRRTGLAAHPRAVLPTRLLQDRRAERPRLHRRRLVPLRRHLPPHRRGKPCAHPRRRRARTPACQDGTFRPVRTHRGRRHPAIQPECGRARRNHHKGQGRWPDQPRRERQCRPPGPDCLPHLVKSDDQGRAVRALVALLGHRRLLTRTRVGTGRSSTLRRRHWAACTCTTDGSPSVGSTSFSLSMRSWRNCPPARPPGPAGGTPTRPSTSHRLPPGGLPALRRQSVAPSPTPSRPTLPRRC